MPSVETGYGSRRSSLLVSELRAMRSDERATVRGLQHEIDVLFPGTFSNSSSIRSDRLSDIVIEVD